MVLFAFWLIPLAACVGFAIDFGDGFLTKIELGKASDAAALAAMRSIGKGQPTAQALATNVFNLNVNSSSSLYVTPPTPHFSFSGGSGGVSPTVGITANATIRTYFIGLLGFHTLSVQNFTQATRPPVILCLMLDRSDSMKTDGGSSAMPGAVSEFISYFLEGTDQLGEVSFSWTASTDVPVATPFVTPITNSVPTSGASVGGIAYGGATNALAGLQAANAAFTGVANPPTNAVKVVVYFTDGWANTLQDTLTCDPGVTLGYGGFDPTTAANVFLQTDNNIWAFYNPTTKTEYDPGGLTPPSSCSYTAGTFPATDPALIGTHPSPYQYPLSRANITTESGYRMGNLASTMEGNGITIYTIGLANSGIGIDTTLLQNLAEPNGLYECAVEGTVPAGEPGCGSVGGGNLKAAFQAVAENIILRLTQ